MDDDEELRYLCYYLVYYCGKNLTTAERELLWACHLTPFIENRPELQEQEKFHRSEEAKRAIAADGLVPTIRATSDAILAREGDKLSVNRCPNCHRVVRTPKTKVCMWCSHNWKASPA